MRVDSSVPLRGRAVSTAVTLAIGAALVAGCGGSSKPSYCGAVSNLENSIKALPSTNVIQSGVSGLESALSTVQTDANKVVSSAKSDFPTETGAVKSSVDALSSTVNAAEELARAGNDRSATGPDRRRRDRRQGLHQRHVLEVQLIAPTRDRRRLRRSAHPRSHHPGSGRRCEHANSRRAPRGREAARWLLEARCRLRTRTQPRPLYARMGTTAKSASSPAALRTTCAPPRSGRRRRVSGLITRLTTAEVAATDARPEIAAARPF